METFEVTEMRALLNTSQFLLFGAEGWGLIRGTLRYTLIPNHSHDLNTSYNDIRVLTSVIEDSLAI